MNPPASSNPPACTCRACGQPMAAAHQPGSGKVVDHFILTCTNPACWMLDYTFSDRSYPTVQLADYRPAAV
ncbi:MAG: hypothetical protein ABI690_13665 [Chloroflexota bacterium]